MTILLRTSEIDVLRAGRYRHTLSLRPIAFQKNGSWMRIAPAFKAGDVNHPNVVDEAPFYSRIAGNGDWKIYPTRDENVWFSIGAPFINPANPTRVSLNPFARSGQVLTSVNANFDARIIHAGHLLKLEFQLKNGYVPPQSKVAFPIDAQGVTRVGNELRANGVTVMQLRPPVVYDAANPIDVRPIASAFQSVSGQLYNIWTLPDMTGMSAPVIDPTLTLQPDATDGVDTVLLEDTPNSTYGTANGIYVQNAVGFHRFSLVRFNLDSIPGGVVFSSGVLSLWNINQVSNTLAVARILVANNTWTEGGASWNYANLSGTRWAGDVGGDAGADAGCSISGTDFSTTDMGETSTNVADALGTEYPISLAVAELQLLLLTNNGLHLRGSSASPHGFASSDDATAANRPQLVAVYTVGTQRIPSIPYHPSVR